MLYFVIVKCDAGFFYTQISRFQRSWGMDPSYMPSRKSFERAGRRKHMLVPSFDNIFIRSFIMVFTLLPDLTDIYLFIYF